MNSPRRFLDRNKVARLVMIVNFGIPEDIGNKVMSMPLLKASIQHIILKELDEQCRNFCKIKKSAGGTGPSVLLVPSSSTQECLENFTWDNTIQEMKEKIPFLLDILKVVLQWQVQHLTAKNCGNIWYIYIIRFPQSLASLLCLSNHCSFYFPAAFDFLNNLHK